MKPADPLFRPAYSEYGAYQSLFRLQGVYGGYPSFREWTLSEQPDSGGRFHHRGYARIRYLQTVRTLLSPQIELLGNGVDFQLFALLLLSVIKPIRFLDR